MSDPDVVASWIEGHRARVLRGGPRFRMDFAAGEWREELPEAITEREQGYAQALADVAEHLRAGELSPGGVLYESQLRADADSPGAD